MLYSKDLTLKFFGHENHPFSFQVMSTSESCGLKKMWYVKLIVSYGTYRKLCSLFNFLLSIHKKLGSLHDFKNRVSW